MTRLIDADALSKKLCETTIFIKGGEIFQRMINDAPTIEPDGGLISRQDAVSEIHKYFVEEIDKTPTEIDEDGDELYTDMPTVNSLLACNKELSRRIKSLPSAPDSRQRGEWVRKENVFGVAYCSNCGYELHTNDTPFCPNCGADMRGEEE